MKNMNLGGGMNTLMNYFLDNYSTNDLMVIMDGDNTQNPKYILSMLKKLKTGYNVVIASRYRPGSKVEGLSLIRHNYSLGARFYYTLVLGIKGVRDYTCGYRVYDYPSIRALSSEYGTKMVEKTSFACMMEILYKISKLGFKVGEVPFVLRYDLKMGNSKIKVSKTIIDSLSTAFKLRFFD